jgi:N-ethylmaleimide reductase
MTTLFDSFRFGDIAVANRLVMAPLTRDRAGPDFAPFDFAALRKLWSGAWIVNNGYTRQMAIDTLAAGQADAISFGKAFISNPDLARRLREDRELAPLNQKTMYGGGPEGYTDYPALAD